MNKWIVLAVLFAVAAVAVAKGGQGNWEYDNDHFHISVTGNGNVPKYTFYSKSDSGNKYQLRFQQLFEAETSDNGLKKLGKSNIALPSQTWEWSSVVEIDNENTTEYYFNITSYNGKHGNTLQYGMLRFINHVTFDNGTLYGKIDVEVDNYQWVSTQSDAKLVLLFRYSQENGNDSENDGTQSSSDAVQYNNAFFTINTTAIEYPSGRNFSVALNKLNSDNGDDSKGMWVIYDHFENGFRHDPSFGVTNAGLSGGAIAGIVIAVVVVVSVGVVFLVLFVTKKGPFKQ